MTVLSPLRRLGLTVVAVAASASRGVPIGKTAPVAISMTSLLTAAGRWTTTTLLGCFIPASRRFTTPRPRRTEFRIVAFIRATCRISSSRDATFP